MTAIPELFGTGQDILPVLSATVFVPLLTVTTTTTFDTTTTKTNDWAQWTLCQDDLEMPLVLFLLYGRSIYE